MSRHTAKKASLAAGLSLSLSLAALTSAAPVLANPLAQVPVAGAVIGLAGTNHLWIADALGTLHWAGDTRALAGKNIQWGSRSEVSLSQLMGMRRGSPWLTAGLLKSGDPIYFVKWETNEAAPQMLRIQSIADVELFGIDSSNYGTMVLDEIAWERAYPFDFETLVKGTLPGATGSTVVAPAPAPMPAPIQLQVARAVQYRNAAGESVHEVDITGAAAGTRLQVSGSYDMGETRGITFGPEDAGAVAASGTLTWRRTHPTYTGARYTFTDPAGHSVTTVFSGDPS